MWLARFARRRRPVPPAPTPTKLLTATRTKPPAPIPTPPSEAVLSGLCDICAHPPHADGRPKPDRQAQVFRLMLALDRGSFHLLMQRLHSNVWFHDNLIPILLDCYPLF